MAYLHNLDIRCAWAPGCRQRAAVELFNRYNAPLGRYCRRHGQQRYLEQQAREKAVDGGPPQGPLDDPEEGR